MKHRLSVLLMGAGQIGARHLQGLLRAVNPLEIVVVDPSPASLELSRTRAAEISTLTHHSVQYQDDVRGIRTSHDFAIIATSARDRAAAIESLFNTGRVNALLLEKVLFQTTEDLDRIERFLAGHATNTWVNCPRRMMPFYRSLAPRLSASGPVQIQVRGGDWGLLCNAIHFIDLLNFFTGERPLSLDASQLEAPHTSRRAEYLDATGTLTAAFSRGSHLFLQASAIRAPVEVTIETRDETIRVEETLGRARWGAIAQPMRNVPQSELTGVLADHCVRGEPLPLTTYAESAVLHRSFLEELRRYFAEYADRYPVAEWGTCPIT